jgi:hypothetical protein
MEQVEAQQVDSLVQPLEPLVLQEEHMEPQELLEHQEHQVQVQDTLDMDKIDDK